MGLPFSGHSYDLEIKLLTPQKERTPAVQVGWLVGLAA